jgi:hypothetical protein
MRAFRPPRAHKNDRAAYRQPSALRALFVPFFPLPHGVGVSYCILSSPCHRSAHHGLIGPIALAVTSTDVDLKIPLKVADAAAVSTVNGGVVTTKETGAYVLKPFRSPKSKKLKTAVVFVPRLSHFDIENERSNKNEFRVRPSSPPSAIHMTLTIMRSTGLGILYALLDFDIYMGSPHLRSKHRNTRHATQSAICHHVLARCPHVGVYRCRTCLEHGNQRAIRESGQSGLDQVLLDGRYLPTFAPGIHTLRRNQVDVQPVRVFLFVDTTKPDEYGLANGHGFNPDF